MIENLYEKNLVINNRELKYQGIFKVEELLQVINAALEQRHYEKREKKTEEKIFEAGRKSYIELRPYKHKTNFMTLMIKIKLTLENIKEVVEEREGRKQKFQQGEVLIAFDAWLMGEYQHRWQMKPLVFFLKGLINKYIYTWPMEAGFPDEVADDTAFIYAQVRSLLNSYSIESTKGLSE